MGLFEWSFLQTWQYQFTDLSYPRTDCTGKTAVVTGATGGLGLEAGRHFARLKAAKVILGCRNTERGEAAKRAIEDSIKDLGPDVVEVWPVDLGSFESVKEFCDRANSLDRLDYMIQNAGLAAAKYKSLEGYEETITVNVLSTFLTTLLLLPVLRKTVSAFNTMPHVTIVASDAHYFTSFPQRKEPIMFQALKGDNDMANRYYISKLLVVLIAREMANALDTSPKCKIVLNTVNPGFCDTDLWRNAPWPLLPILKFMARHVGRTPEMGSRTLMWAVFAGDETHGAYSGDCMLHDMSALARSEDGHATGRRAYGELLNILESVVPGISGNI
ncbi:hypothetical protein JX265_011260 [Neoarthrinium moseri]|uniref:Uncharacterized protein n=1 Tax=Neoarthrinium moseri TaxID=1658444 RepID=A0A9P9WD50_9PEZI|nr:hypothetical protein JX266_007931 [Neoarthrinium moseri]KAI1857525.1 hypothetical protein JX265_011260 [Neoarthrinium moseri]